MTPFISKRLWLLGTWIFIATLVADCINVTDFLPNIVTTHSDEESIDQNANRGVIAMDSDSPLAPSHHDSPKNPGDKSPTVKLIIVDQDSPSLAAESLISWGESSPFRNGESITRQSPVLAETLYLKLRTLLI